MLHRIGRHKLVRPDSQEREGNIYETEQKTLPCHMADAAAHFETRDQRYPYNPLTILFIPSKAHIGTKPLPTCSSSENGSPSSLTMLQSTSHRLTPTLHQRTIPV